MTRLRLILLGLFALAAAAPTARAQTCNANIPESTPTSRFTLNGSEATDTKTGLIWKRCPEGYTFSNNTCTATGATTFTWQAALQRAQTQGGGWRLPNINELTSIVELKCYYPAINLTVFPDSSTGIWFWSASPSAINSGGAWGVRIDDGLVHSGSDTYKTYAYHVRLVRGGQ